MSKKNLLNYTTDVPVSKTVMEIQEELGRIKARSVMFDYDENGGIEAIAFKVLIKNSDGQEQELAFKLPAKVEEAYKVIFKGRSMEWKYKEQRMEQARRVAWRIAWRIVKDWLEVQVAIITLQMAKTEEVFLPYLLVGGNKTLFEVMETSRFALPPGIVEGEVIQ